METFDVGKSYNYYLPQEDLYEIALHFKPKYPIPEEFTNFLKICKQLCWIYVNNPDLKELERLIVKNPDEKILRKLHDKEIFYKLYPHVEKDIAKAIELLTETKSKQFKSLTMRKCWSELRDAYTFKQMMVKRARDRLKTNTKTMEN